MFVTMVVMSQDCGLLKVQPCVAPYVPPQGIAFEEKHWRIQKIMLSVRVWWKIFCWSLFPVISLPPEEWNTKLWKSRPKLEFTVSLSVLKICLLLGMPLRQN